MSLESKDQIDRRLEVSCRVIAASDVDPVICSVSAWAN